jgi:hypothetical protein
MSVNARTWEDGLRQEAYKWFVRGVAGSSSRLWRMADGVLANSHFEQHEQRCGWIVVGAV